MAGRCQRLLARENSKTCSGIRAGHLTNSGSASSTRFLRLLFRGTFEDHLKREFSVRRKGNDLTSRQRLSSLGHSQRDQQENEEWNEASGRHEHSKQEAAGAEIHPSWQALSAHPRPIRRRPSSKRSVRW